MLRVLDSRPADWASVCGRAKVYHRAKRMERVELAPAFGLAAAKESASKLDALHTLREVRTHFCRYRVRQP
jgi:hypothetical protein